MSTYVGFIGIDPGQSGGIARVKLDGSVILACKMPETERDVWDLFKLAQAPGPSFDVTPCFAMIERVHSMPKQGVSSSFKFGKGYGFLRGCLTASGIPWEDVTPQAWQKTMACMTGGDKNVSKAKAQQLFPAVKVTHALADALLIAEYCRRTVLSRTGGTV